MSSRHPTLSPLRRFFAAASAALVLLLTIAAASPRVHAALHDDAHASDTDACAVVLFASGVTLALAAMAMTVPRWREFRDDLRAGREFFPVAPRYLRQPERGPPAS